MRHCCRNLYMRHCCRNCHFLAKTNYLNSGGKHTDTWSKEEREKGELRHKGRSAASCWHGIWDTGVNPELNARLEKVIDKKRKNRCFFVEFDEDGMLFEGAVKIYNARNEQRDRTRDFYYWLAGVVLTVILAALSLVVSKEFRELVKEIIDGLSLYMPTYPI